MNIYLDTNIFSRLKPQEQLNNYYHTVKKHSCTNCYFYSRAHIYDLLNDKTDTKYQDLSLISEITKNRYLVKALPNPVKIYNQAPLSAFNYELSELDNKVDLSEFENSPKLKSIIDNLKNTLASIDVPEMDLSLFPTETRKYINNILEQKNNFDFHKLVQNGLSYENTLYTNTTEYKSLRSLLMSYKNQIFTKSNASISIDNINSR